MKTLGQIAHDAGKFDRQWHQMGEGQKADWERIAQAVIDAQQVAVPAKREPLSRDQILDGFCKAPDCRQYVTSFKAGVEFAEAHHGITAQGDKP